MALHRSTTRRLGVAVLESGQRSAGSTSETPPSGAHLPPADEDDD